MLKILANRFGGPVIACFLIPESRNFNGLVLIRFCLARATRARASRFIQRASGSCATRRKAEAGAPVRGRINLAAIANRHCNQCKNCRC
jgi:hypothetical protein